MADLSAAPNTPEVPRLPIDPALLSRSTPIDELPEFMTPNEVRAYLGLGRSTMYDLLKREEMPHVRFGRVIRIPKAALVRVANGVE